MTDLVVIAIGLALLVDAWRVASRTVEPNTILRFALDVGLAVFVGAIGTGKEGWATIGSALSATFFAAVAYFFLGDHEDERD